MNHRRRVVFGVLATPGRILKNGSAKGVIGMGVGAAYTLVDHVIERHLGFPLHRHADLNEHGDNARVLTDGSMPHGAHA